MSRIIVTGGSGRLGRSVVSELVDAAHEVVSVDMVANPECPAAQVLVDLCDAEATGVAFREIQPDAVVHLAAIAVPFSRPDAVIYATNTGILYHVLDATLASGATALLVASSPTVIGYGNPRGWVPSYLPLDEDHPTEPWHGYSASKAAMESIVAMAARQYGDILHTHSFRPCYVIAPEEWEGAPTQQGHTVRERLDDPALSAVALFNYVDARDVGSFVQAWLDRYETVPNGTCFFVGAADALARRPVADLWAEHLGAADAARTLEGDAPVFSIKRAERLLGWVPKRSWRTELDTTTKGMG